MENAKKPENVKLSQKEVDALEKLTQQIEYVSLADIRLSANKARKIAKGIPKVAASIKALGFRSPIYVDKHGEIIAGHTRYCAAKLLGIDKVPVVRAEDLSPSLVRYLRLADNRSGEFSSWNFDELGKTVAEIKKELPDLDLGELGFVDQASVDWDSVPELSEDNYQEPDGEALVCPVCGFRARRVFFIKQDDKEADEEAKTDLGAIAETEEIEKEAEKPAEEAKQPRPKHDHEDVEAVMKALASQVAALTPEELEKTKSLVQRIEYVQLDAVKPSANKERNIRKAIPKVAAVMRKVGFRNPIFADAKTAEIICGHTRWHAAKYIGLTKVPVVFVSDLTPAQTTLFRLADNRVAEFTAWEFVELNKEIDEIKVEIPEADLTDAGFFEKPILLWDAEKHKASPSAGKTDEKLFVCPKCGKSGNVETFKEAK